MKRITCALLSCAVLTLSLYLATPVSSQDDPCSLGTEYKGCAACGTAGSKPFKEANVLKNRDEKATDFDDSITLEAIFKYSSNDYKRWNSSQAAKVTGYVVTVEPGGFKESCNCGRVDLQDIHIEMVTKESYKGNATKVIIAEITPRWHDRLGLVGNTFSKKLKNLKTEILNKWVTFEGWMFFDIAHPRGAVNTKNVKSLKKFDVCKSPTCDIWRRTAWEIHPVTAYTVVNQ